MLKPTRDDGVDPHWSVSSQGETKAHVALTHSHRPGDTGIRQTSHTKVHLTTGTYKDRHTHLQFAVAPPEWPAISEVVLRMPRVGSATPSSAWVRGTELARVETRRCSGWSSLRLRRRRLRLGSLKLRPLRRLIRLWETTSSKRSRCFLGMKILAKVGGQPQLRLHETTTSKMSLFPTNCSRNKYAQFFKKNVDLQNNQNRIRTTNDSNHSST